MCRLLVATVAFVVVILAPSAWGQNLVANPDFATDVAGWSPGLNATIDWSPLDAGAAPGSGSGLVTNLSTTSNEASGARHCIGGISAGIFYLSSAEVLVPSGQSETGKADLLVQWYAAPGCGGGQLGLDSTSDVRSSTPDVWYDSSGYVQAPSGAQSARLRLSVFKTEDYGTLHAHFDNVVFEEMIFGDGFESNDLTAWSTTVP
jgi:hypothetical protein